MLVLLALSALGLAGCASLLDGWASRNRDRREFVVRKVWVRPSVADIQTYRKINRMTPLLSGNTLITGNAMEGLVAWDRESGRELWRLAETNGVEGGAALVRDRLFFGNSEGMFSSVDVRNGRPFWSTSLKAEILGAPLLDTDSGTVFVSTAAGVVYAIEAESGRTLWLYSRQDPVAFSIRGASRPALLGETLYIGMNDGFLVALNAKTGALRWDVQLNRNKRFKDLDTAVLIDGDRLFVAGYDDKLYCLSAERGQVLWRLDEGGYADLTKDGPRLFYSTSDGELLALDKESGKIQWRKSVNNGIGTSAVPYQGLLAVGESQGSLLFLESASGKEVGRFEPGRGVFSAPLVDDKNHRVYFISGEANVYALEAQWKLKADHFDSSFR